MEIDRPVSRKLWKDFNSKMSKDTAIESACTGDLVNADLVSWCSDWLYLAGHLPNFMSGVPVSSSNRIVVLMGRICGSTVEHYETELKPALYNAVRTPEYEECLSMVFPIAALEKRAHSVAKQLEKKGYKITSHAAKQKVKRFVNEWLRTGKIIVNFNLSIAVKSRFTASAMKTAHANSIKKRSEPFRMFCEEKFRLRNGSAKDETIFAKVCKKFDIKSRNPKKLLGSWREKYWKVMSKQNGK
jgi:hypothetical protein